MAEHLPSRRVRWLSALVLVLASCDRKSPPPAPAAEVEADGTASGRTTTGAKPSAFSSSTGLLSGLDEVLGDKSATSGTATAAVSEPTTDSIPIAEGPKEPDTIGEKHTSTDATAIAEPDRVDPTAGVAGASASTRTQKPETVETLAPSTPAPTSGPLALGGTDSLDAGDRVQMQTTAGGWVAGKIIRVNVDGTYDVEHDGVIERRLGAAKLRKQRG